MRIEANDMRELKIFKYYRLARKWFCKNYDIMEADLELLIYFDCIGIFSRQDYINGTYVYSWDKHRWERLVRDGWIVVYSKRNRTTVKYNTYKVSTKCKLMINRLYKVLLGQEDLQHLKEQDSYTSKVMSTALDYMNKDNTR